MSRFTPTPDRLFDRLWQPGYPLRPRLGRLRRWGVLGALVLLCGLIFAYWYWTNPTRVRAMAEKYLTQLVGGPVKVGGASLSIFEGLRFDGVEVFVDAGEPKADSLIFSAKTLYVQYDLPKMLAGTLRATQIRAIDPRVRLIEDRDTRRWNFQRLNRDVPLPVTPDEPRAEELVLPEVLLRNARIEYGEMRAGALTSVGSMGIEGKVAPAEQSDQYVFDLQSRGTSDVGPVISGWVDLKDMQISARMRNFEFGSDIRGMLPGVVRDWWQQHALAGRLNVPRIEWSAGKDGAPAKFRVETDLESVTLKAVADEWRTRDEVHRAAALQWMWKGLRSVHRAARPRADWREDFHSPSPSFYDHLAAHFDADEILLHKVSGTLVFSDTGIEIESLRGRVETNAIEIKGSIKGYSPESPIEIRISSIKGENIYVPPSPRYVGAMPDAVREIFERLRPQGTCAFEVKVARGEGGRAIDVTGSISVLDGQFVFDRFPYPVRKATGKISIDRDPATGMNMLKISDLSGLGVAGGPNRDARVTVNGFIGPLGPDAGVSIRVDGKQIASEPALRAAFPRDVRRAMRSMDSTGRGDYPRFKANFVCDILRPIGFQQHWTVNTDIDVLDASGSLAAFPYPLTGLRGMLRIREGHLVVEKLTMAKGDAILVIDGKVNWQSQSDEHPDTSDDDSSVPLRPDLTVTARNVPIDAPLIAALPPGRREWVEKLGLGGALDIDGRIFPSHRGATDEVDVDLSIALRAASIWPGEGTFSISDITGRMRLSHERLELTDIRGKRGEAKVTVNGLLEWPAERPRMRLDASSENLALDASLYAALPAGVKRAWDKLKPRGAVDLDLSIQSDDLEAADIDLSALKLSLRPQKLSITPAMLPYQLDELEGLVEVDGSNVTLHDLKARHGDAKLRFSGTGSIDDNAAWELKIAGQDVRIDEPLLVALPETLSELVRSVEMKGVVDFELDRLKYQPSPLPPDATSATTREAPVDVEFALKLRSNDASLNIGVPLLGAKVEIELAGNVRADAVGALEGGFNVESMTLADRQVTAMSATISKPPDDPLIRIGQMRATLAGGDLAGEIEMNFDEAAGGYALELVLRNADVRELAAEIDKNIRGRLNASLALAGRWNDPKSRRGRGDVSLAGQNIYRIPVVLGLLQITNLALPITKPLSSAGTRYSLDGQRVTLESIELKSDSMQMNGYGHIDFGTKQVRLTLNTDAGNWDKLPFFGDFVRRAKEELLQIHVRGTIEEPKVETRSLNTFQTTVDEVFQGEGRR